MILVKTFLFIIYIFSFINFVNIIVKETNYNKGIKRILNNLTISSVSVVGLYVVEYYI